MTNQIEVGQDARKVVRTEVVHNQKPLERELLMLAAAKPAAEVCAGIVVATPDGELLTPSRLVEVTATQDAIDLYLTEYAILTVDSDGEMFTLAELIGPKSVEHIILVGLLNFAKTHTFEFKDAVSNALRVACKKRGIEVSPMGLLNAGEIIQNAAFLLDFAGIPTHTQDGKEIATFVDYILKDLPHDPKARWAAIDAQIQMTFSNVYTQEEIHQLQEEVFRRRAGHPTTTEHDAHSLNLMEQMIGAHAAMIVGAFSGSGHDVQMVKQKLAQALSS